MRVGVGAMDMRGCVCKRRMGIRWLLIVTHFVGEVNHAWRIASREADNKADDIPGIPQCSYIHCIDPKKPGLPTTTLISYMKRNTVVHTPTKVSLLKNQDLDKLVSDH